MHEPFYLQERKKGMSFIIEIFLIGVGLAMDAFAVSICKGLTMQKVKKKDVLIIGLFFGGFQFLMPLLGYLCGSAISSIVETLASIIGFTLTICYFYISF